MIVKYSNNGVYLYLTGLFVIIHFENVLSQSENSRKQHFLRNDEQQQEVDSKYIIHTSLIFLIIKYNNQGSEFYLFLYTRKMQHLSFLWLGLTNNINNFFIRYHQNI